MTTKTKRERKRGKPMSKKVRGRYAERNVDDIVGQLDEALRIQGPAGFRDEASLANFFGVSVDFMRKWLQTAHRVWKRDVQGFIVHVSFSEVAQRLFGENANDLDQRLIDYHRKHRPRKYNDHELAQMIHDELDRVLLTGVGMESALRTVGREFMLESFEIRELLREQGFGVFGPFKENGKAQQYARTISDAEMQSMIAPPGSDAALVSIFEEGGKHRPKANREDYIERDLLRTLNDLSDAQSDPAPLSLMKAQQRAIDKGHLSQLIAMGLWSQQSVTQGHITEAALDVLQAPLVGRFGDTSEGGQRKGYAAPPGLITYQQVAGRWDLLQGKLQAENATWPHRVEQAREAFEAGHITRAKHHLKDAKYAASKDGAARDAVAISGLAKLVEGAGTQKYGHGEERARQRLRALIDALPVMSEDDRLTKGILQRAVAAPSLNLSNIENAAGLSRFHLGQRKPPVEFAAWQAVVDAAQEAKIERGDPHFGSAGS